MATNSVVGDGIWPIQSFMVVLITDENEKYPFKTEEARVVTAFLPL